MTKLIDKQTGSKLSSKQKKKKIEYHFSEILKTLELDLTDPSLSETPARVAKMYVDEIFYGLDPQKFPSVTYYECKDMQDDDMIVISNISVNSTCEHHFVPVVGSAYIGYFPSGKIIGLSKINRIVEYFSKRPQLQERLTTQIADCLSYILDTEDIAVYIKAKHFCVTTRGVQDKGSETITKTFRGKFKDSGVKKDFLIHIR
ncbi:MAG: GTP cyclohydrolase 1 [Chlamydiia bacterium]|nr:GTP cyclohydrolase 1 [Chlamydiia bacterium]